MHTTLDGVNTLAEKFPWFTDLISPACTACTQQLTSSAFMRQLTSVPDTVSGVHYTIIQTQYDLVEFIGRLSPINKVLYNRELALFYADHDLKLEEGLRLARKELEVRHDIYTWDAFAWALYKSGQLREAADAMTKAMRPGTKDPMLFFHAGMIYDRLGQSDKAREYLGRALCTNPHFHIFYAERATRTLLEGLRSQRLEVRSQKSADRQK